MGFEYTEFVYSFDYGETVCWFEYTSEYRLEYVYTNFLLIRECFVNSLRVHLVFASRPSRDLRVLLRVLLEYKSWTPFVNTSSTKRVSPCTPRVLSVYASRTQTREQWDSSTQQHVKIIDLYYEQIDQQVDSDLVLADSLASSITKLRLDLFSLSKKHRRD
jgi:hypothetical protein